MTDRALELLQEFIQDTGKTTLCIADENLLTDIQRLQQHPQLALISNRWDVTQRAQAAGLNCQFSDMDFSAIADASVEQVVYRVSKEKPLVNHVIRQAFRLLMLGGQLHISGEKGDGTKTYIEKAGKLFGGKVPAQKNGSFYLGSLVKKQAQADSKALKALDDKHYHELRAIGELAGQPLYSKPGQFGWNKLDRGSELLISVADKYLSQMRNRPKSLLDLGCGYGYLTLNSLAWDSIERRTATDNNAAALLSVTRNSQQHPAPIQVVADDCGESIIEKFDLVLCNPPFHQGFDVEGGLTNKFLKRMYAALNKGGVALVVTNLFIPLEHKACNLFGKHNGFVKVDILEDNGAFKVIALHR